MPAKPPRPTSRKKKPSDFFDSVEPHSRIKSRIVAAYVPTWANVILSRAPRVVYIDLFAGWGQYKDGAPSTPLILLQTFINNPRLCAGVATWFSDESKAAVKALGSHIAAIPGLAKLTFQPEVHVSTVNSKTAQELVKAMVPAFAFLDPFGYMGISVDLIRNIIKDWGSECIFYFNYNRIRPAINNPLVFERMNAIFGEQRSEKLRRDLKIIDRSKAEAAVILALREAMNEIGGKYVLPFRFRKLGRTTHHLVFVTKDFKGLEIMRGIMSKHSSARPQNVPSFEYVENEKGILLFEPTPLDDLKRDLMAEYSGHSVSFGALYKDHSATRLCIKENYREAISALRDASRVTLTRAGKAVPKNTVAQLPEDVVLTFSHN